jgi:hypothetical protein
VNIELERMCKEAVMAEVEVLSRHFPGETEVNHEISQDSRCPGQDSNRAPSEYKLEGLPLDLFSSR